MIPSFLLMAAGLLPGAIIAQESAGPPPPIADNSFLLEEAYNQEWGVVQHISTFVRLRDVDSWAYSFTQEWPISGQRHQLGFTIPVQRLAVGTVRETGLGDVAINYRYQLLGRRDIAIAPRLSMLLPTGDERRGLGVGALGVQTNLPVSIRAADRIVFHGNAGVTLIPRAQNASGARARTMSANVGGSVVWHLRTTVDLLLEVTWSVTESVSGPAHTSPSETLLLGPGIRWAHNFSSGLQVVPGIAIPIGLGSSRGESGFFLYLSLEHPFRKNTASR